MTAPLPNAATATIDTSDPDALMSALVTEHFALQSAASATISESSSRASTYLAALSSGLVAIGFASSSPAVLMILACTIFPTVFLLGWFTVVRLVDTTVENVTAQHRIERIRRYYASVDRRGPAFFAPQDDRLTGSLGVRYSFWSILSTLASMIGFVNAVLAGVAVALVLSLAAATPIAVGSAVGVAVAVVLLAGTLLYEHRRLRVALTTG